MRVRQLSACLLAASSINAVTEAPATARLPSLVVTAAHETPTGTAIQTDLAGFEGLSVAPDKHLLMVETAEPHSGRGWGPNTALGTGGPTVPADVG